MSTRHTLVGALPTLAGIVLTAGTVLAGVPVTRTTTGGPSPRVQLDSCGLYFGWQGNTWFNHLGTDIEAYHTRVIFIVNIFGGLIHLLNGHCISDKHQTQLDLSFKCTYRTVVKFGDS